MKLTSDQSAARSEQATTKFMLSIVDDTNLGAEGLEVLIFDMDKAWTRIKKVLPFVFKSQNNPHTIHWLSNS